jgi:putative transcriptional regulator
VALARPKPPKQIVEDDVLATAHGLAAALHRIGTMDELSMREMDQLCLPPRLDYTGPDVRRIRAAARMS